VIASGDHVPMNGVQVGRTLRTIRLRAGKRQEDVATLAGVSRSFVAKVESGAVDSIDLGRIDSVCRALGAVLDLRVRWRGEHLDRLIDEAHATPVELVVRMLRGAGWLTVVEHSFSEFGERGSIDVFAWHPTALTVLVIEVKTLIADAQDTFGRHDRKVRLAPKLAADRGWTCRHVARLLIVGDTSTNRRHVASLGSSFQASYPLRGDPLRRWVRHPDGPMAGLLFVPYATPRGTGAPPVGRMRVVVRGSRRVQVQTPPSVADEPAAAPMVTGGDV
jgi:transcriptional regulator with XRE-family HTH domain